MEEKKITKKATCKVTWDDGTTSIMHYEVGFIPSKEYGFFEYYDDESGGMECHAEGGLWFEDRKCVDYDGVYQLNYTVIELCKEMNLDMSEIE